MAEFFIFLYAFYIFAKIFISILQYRFISKINENCLKILDDSNFFVAREYAIEKEKLNIISSIYDLLIFGFWIFVGLEILSKVEISQNFYINTISIVELFIIANWFFGLPFEIYQTFGLDKKYGFSTISGQMYFKDTIKSGFLFFIFGSLVIFGLIWLIHNFEQWWIFGASFLVGVFVLINILYPIIRDKMFDKFEPLKDQELNEKISALLQSVGFSSSGIFSVDASKRDNRLNAYFGGIGKTKRVVLFDTLIQKLSHSELLAVLGHELGHFKNKDMIKNILIMSGFIFALFAIFGNLSPQTFQNLSIPNDAGFILIFIILFSTPVLFFAMPIIWYFSRKNEFNADKFGSNLQSKADLKSALLKLANENKHFPYSHSLQVFFYYSHPPLTQRLEKL